MKEPDRNKDIAIAFTFFRANGKLDWSKSVDVRVYRYKEADPLFLKRWEVVTTSPEEKIFQSLEEAIIHFNMKNIKLYKTKNDTNMMEMTPRNSIWPNQFKNFTHLTRTMKKLKSIREKP
jgi:hypothetical protein